MCILNKIRLSFNDTATVVSQKPVSFSCSHVEKHWRLSRHVRRPSQLLDSFDKGTAALMRLDMKKKLVCSSDELFAARKKIKQG